MSSGSRLSEQASGSLLTVLAIACAVIVCALAQASLASAAPLSIRIEGNHFVNGAGQTIRLLGVNHPSFEYGCVEGFGYNDGHMDNADAAAVASWNADAVRVPLNEDCWLGINGQPSNSQGPNPPLTMAGYRQAVESYVAALNAHGIYAILDLHWTAPGNLVADGQRPMPDAHSTDFWTSVASTFKENPAVVFDLFNEPYSPALVNDPAHPVSWACWENGGCQVPTVNDSEAPNGNLYQAVGMQALVNAVRATGATQPLMVGGLAYANDLSQWLAFAPHDPLGQEAASFHNYQGEGCDSSPCWNSTIAAVAAQVPVVTGEFDQEVCGPSNFDDEYMSWADAHGVGYLAWGWWVLGQAEINGAGCSAYYLLSDYNGAPADPNGTNLRNHLLTLPPGGVTLTSTSTSTTPAGAGGSGSNGGKLPIELTTFHAHVEASGGAIAFELRSAQSCTGSLGGQTIKPFAAGSKGHKRHKVSLGTVHLKLAAGKAKSVVLKLPGAARHLLAVKRSLAARFTLILGNVQSQQTVLHRQATLTEPVSHRHGQRGTTSS